MSMKMLKAALAATAMIGGPAALTAAAQAQYGPAAPQTTPSAPAPQAQDPAAPAAPVRPYNLSRAERTAFQPAIVAVTAGDWATAQTALTAAAETARGADAKYLVGQIRLQIGIGTNNSQVQAQGIDEMIASGGARPNELPALYENQLDFATAAGDTAKAQRAQAQLDALNPNDPNRFVRQARIRAGANDSPGAIAAYQQAIQATQAAGQPIPVDWRQQIAGLAYRARLPQTVGYMRDWLVAAPTPALWHDTLAIYAELANPAGGLKLDIYRLMRAAGAMTSERDYIQLGEAAQEVRAFGEVKAVLDEGLARNLIATNAGFARERLAVVNRRIAEDRTSLPGERTAALAGSDGIPALRLGDSYYGYGEYGPAIDLYRAALQKGGPDANLVNTRLGAALALAGRRAEAEAAFRAVTGPRAELAQFWLLWLSTRG
jgi:tetratricopeptide (TPR) repeat protein